MNLPEIESNTDTSAWNSNTATDEQLVSAAKSGDSRAFVELSRRHSRKLLLKTYRMTNNWQDAEDIVQESLIKAFTHLHTFESKSLFSTWLMRIAINSALMLLRKRRGFLMLTIDGTTIDGGYGETFELRDRRNNPEQCYAQCQTKERLRTAIQRMRPKYREILELQQAGGLSMNEISHCLNISMPAVKSRLLRARRELRQHVK
jgi:RNA polymerase sigma-70 factor (ECF subfamily)